MNINLRVEGENSPWNQLREAITIRNRYLTDKDTAEQNIRKQNNLIKTAIHRALKPIVEKYNTPMSIDIKENTIEIYVPVSNMPSGIALANLVFKYDIAVTKMIDQKLLTTIINETDSRIEYHKQIEKGDILPNREDKVSAAEPVVTVNTRTAYFK